MGKLLREKLIAFSTHLGVSALVIGTLYGLIYLVWFPYPFSLVEAVSDVAHILLIVDVVIGPVLTFILFKRGKRGMAFDMAMIVVLQLGALVYGVHAIYTRRPMYAVFAVDRFEVSTFRDVVSQEIPVDIPRIFPWTRPQLVVALIPEDKTERSKLLEEVVFEGKADLAFRPNLYQPYAEFKNEVLKKAKPLVDLKNARRGEEAAFNRALAQMNKPQLSLENLVYLPLAGNKNDAALVLDPITAEPLAAVKVFPFLIEKEPTTTSDEPALGEAPRQQEKSVEPATPAVKVTK